MLKLIYTLANIRFVEDVYGSQLSYILDKPSLSIFPIWYTIYITLNIHDISFPTLLSLAEKPGLTITIALYLVFCMENLV